MNRTQLDDLIDDLMTDEPGNEPRHACWLILLADNTEQRIGAWPPLSRDEVLAAYRCADARAEK